MIRFGSYNICNGWNGRIESVVRGISQANIDLGIFQETKVTGGGLRKRVRRVPGHGDQGTDPASQRRCRLLPIGGEFHP